jgi:hypothetical protein
MSTVFSKPLNRWLKRAVLVLPVIGVAMWYFTTAPLGVDFVGATNDISGCTEFGFPDAPQPPPQTPAHFTVSPSEVVKSIAQTRGSCGTKLVWSELWADEESYYVIYRGAFDFFQFTPYSRAILQSRARYLVNGLTGAIQVVNH